MLQIGFMFGGVSVEHEVSVISSLQAAAALDRSRYHPVPIYVAKSGIWYTGDHLLDIPTFGDLDDAVSRAVPVSLIPGSAGRGVLRGTGRPGILAGRPFEKDIDLLFLGFHGGDGENGSFQGLCESLNIPYTGSGVLGSSVGMDKVLSKMLCRDQEIPVVDYVWFRESEWADREEEWLDRCEESLGYPVVVKPARLGSSIGISKAKDRAELDAAVEFALRYDEKVVVEKAVERLREINCSVLGDPNEAVASVLEEPLSGGDDALLSFADKYERGGGSRKRGGSRTVPEGKAGSSPSSGMASLDRVIPAELSSDQTKEIQALGVRVFQLFECAGVARIDFMIDEADGSVYFNEINTIPGSFSFYLWEPSGVPFDELVHRMIELGIKRHREKNSRVRSYETNLLSSKSLSGLKGAKGR